MFYKVMKNNKVIDVLNELVYLKYQPKHDRMIFCEAAEAQAIFSSDRQNIWHVDILYNMPIDRYDTVNLVQIDEYEYRQRKILSGNTPEEIIDAFVLDLIQNEVI